MLIARRSEKIDFAGDELVTLVTVLNQFLILRVTDFTFDLILAFGLVNQELIRVPVNLATLLPFLVIIIGCFSAIERYFPTAF